MTSEIAHLEKEVKKCKRIANEWAMQLHDLSEERLPAAFVELPELAESTYQACQAWQQAVANLNKAKG